MRQHLLTGEKLVYKAKLHWIIFLKPMIFLVLSLTLLAFGNHILPDIFSSNLPGALVSFRFYGLDLVRCLGMATLLLMCVPTSIYPLVRAWTSEFWVSNKRVLIKMGLIRRNSFEIMLKKIEAIAVDQSILGRLLNYGSVGIVGTGSSKEVFTMIQRPLEFRRQIQEQLDLL
jgi:uncharacterized membrane protein YdbT with pleckstrin-like domain